MYPLSLGLLRCSFGKDILRCLRSVDPSCFVLSSVGSIVGRRLWVEVRGVVEGSDCWGPAPASGLGGAGRSGSLSLLSSWKRAWKLVLEPAAAIMEKME